MCCYYQYKRIMIITFCSLQCFNVKSIGNIFHETGLNLIHIVHQRYCVKVPKCGTPEHHPVHFTVEVGSETFRVNSDVVALSHE